MNLNMRLLPIIYEGEFIEDELGGKKLVLKVKSEDEKQQVKEVSPQNVIK